MNNYFYIEAYSHISLQFGLLLRVNVSIKNVFIATELGYKRKLLFPLFYSRDSADARRISAAVSRGFDLNSRRRREKERNAGIIDGLG